MIDEQVAAGLYSRICLVTNNWDDAITYARKARAGYSVYTPSELIADAAFNNINAKEWIWGADITAETTSKFASFFSFMCSYDAGYGGDAGQYRKIDARLYDSMNASDSRKLLFKHSSTGVEYTAQEQKFAEYTNIKFKKVANWEADYVYMRVSEMILNEAEALAHKGDNIGAATVLKELMSQRDPSWNLNSVTVDDVYHQRRLELWGEGFSLFDHLRLKNFTLGFTLPNQWTQKLMIDKVRVYFSGNNLLTWAKWKQYDPETPVNGEVFCEAPAMRTFSFGAQLSF